MPPYDDRLFVPPAPVLTARLRNPRNGTIVPDVPLLIDTGADVTLLPLGAVNAAGIEQTGASYELLAFDGTSNSAGAVRAELFLLGRPQQTWSEHRDDRIPSR
jgi:predicted aspartyl protease